MRTRPALFLTISLSLLSGLLGVALLFPAQARSSGAAAFDLSWSSVDGGGKTFSSSGTYRLGGTIGQPDAGVASGGSYKVGGGFWGGGAPRHRIYLPLLLRGR